MLTEKKLCLKEKEKNKLRQAQALGANLSDCPRIIAVVIQDFFFFFFFNILQAVIDFLYSIYIKVSLHRVTDVGA